MKARAGLARPKCWRRQLRRRTQSRKPGLHSPRLCPRRRTQLIITYFRPYHITPEPTAGRITMTKRGWLANPGRGGKKARVSGFLLFSRLATASEAAPSTRVSTCCPVIHTYTVTHTHTRLDRLSSTRVNFQCLSLPVSATRLRPQSGGGHLVESGNPPCLYGSQVTAPVKF
jgi:hypothetical protein